MKTYRLKPAARERIAREISRMTHFPSPPHLCKDEFRDLERSASMAWPDGIHVGTIEVSAPVIGMPPHRVGRVRASFDDFDVLDPTP